MIAEVIPKQPVTTIPEHLIYEELKGIPVYYRGYKEVLAKNKTLEDIMGYGDLQSYLLNLISDFLKARIGKTHRVLVGETGLHLAHKNNLSLDLCIYPKSQLSFKKLKNKYFSDPPLVVVEVDAKADPDIFNTTNYFHTKTQELLNFGIPLVVWVFSHPQTIMVATSNQPWSIYKWSDNITILGETFSINQVIEEEES